MSNITCSSKCAHQKDGKCTLGNISVAGPLTPDTGCAYYREFGRK